MFGMTFRGRHLDPFLRVKRGRATSAFTLLEVVLVVGILVLLATLAMPNLAGDIARRRLRVSAFQMRSLLELVRNHAQFDGKRYRIRFPEDDELDPMGGDRQPIIERENDPLKEPDEWKRVIAPWTFGETLLKDVWCVQVRLERPTIEKLLHPEVAVADKLEASFEDFDENRPPLYVEPDGTSPWVTYVLTQADRELEPDDLEPPVYGDDDYPEIIELIVEGPTGMIWLQRPLYQEELELFEENGWPPVLRKDFFERSLLTEDDVLELPESEISP